MHKRKRRSELSNVMNLNFSDRVSFKDKTVNEPRQHKTVRGEPERDVKRGPALVGSEQ